MGQGMWQGNGGGHVLRCGGGGVCGEVGVEAGKWPVQCGGLHGGGAWGGGMAG